MGTSVRTRCAVHRDACDGDTIVFAPNVTSITLADTAQGLGRSHHRGCRRGHRAWEWRRWRLLPQRTRQRRHHDPGLTITGGHAAQGGGIENINEHLTVANDTITGNAATKWGGGISTGGSTPAGTGNSLTVTNSTVTGNTAGDGGGGIYADDSTSVNVDSSSVSNNTATDNGGGGLNVNTVDVLTITNSLIHGNTTDGSGGGGLYLNDIEGALTITDTSISGNTTTSGEVAASTPTTSSA